ncbi:MAG TPA: SBBP repeat-containing protein [Candidatus Solibacter sp.]|nr:SBBP repeat-containing protein [Candidatus Solibacter sp.]
MGQIRLLAAGLALVAAGAMVLGWSSRSRRASVPALAASKVDSALSMAPASSNDIKPEARDRALSLLAGVPLIFEPNQGQNGLDRNDARARFIAHGAGYGLFLGSTGATLSLRATKSGSAASALLQMKLARANPAATLTGASILPGKSNYLIGNDPAKWRNGISQFARVRYENIYPGINLVFYGTQGQLEYDFQVAPGADPSQAELEFDGAKHLELQNGALVIQAEGGSVRLEAPRVYQEVAGVREPVEASFVLRGGNRAGFEIAPYNRSRELIIDPVLSFSTYFGGTGDERNTFVAVDGSGNIYLTGSTTSPSLPAGTVTTVLQSSPGASGAQNIYIAKINPVNNPPQLDYVTYMGGAGPDTPVGIAVDGAGDTFVAGTTGSSDCTVPTNCFPTSSTPYQKQPLTSGEHVFVSELLSDAVTLKYSSYLSGNGDADIASGMAIDSGGHIYVTGTTNSNNAGDGAAGIQFPASTLPQGLPFQPLPSTAPVQFFVTKVNTQAPTTGSITYSTYFGGGNFTTPQPVATGGGITVDTNGNIYFAGTTNFLYTGCAGCGSTDFPIKDAYQPCLNQAPPTVIVNPAQCTNTSTTNSDAFVAKLNPGGPAGGGQLQWSTYLGGTQNDSGTGIAIDTGAANVYITGTTNSPDITTTVSFAGYQPCLNNPTNLTNACTSTGTANDAFVARFSNPVTTTGTTSNVALTYFSYLGGTGDESGAAIVVDNASGAIVTGSTDSVDFPVAPASGNDIQGTYGGNGDAFVARLNAAAVSGQNTVGSWATYFGGSGADEGTGIALDVNQNAYLAGDTTSSDLHLTGLFTSIAGGYDAFVGEVTPNASLALTGVLTLGPNQTYVPAGNQATFTYTLTNQGPEPANNILVTDNISSTVTGVAMTFDSATITSGTCSGGSTSTLISCSVPSLQFGSIATITITLTLTADPQGGARQFNGGQVIASATNSLGPVTTTVSGSMSDFSIGVNPDNVSIAAGVPASYLITLTPNPVYSPAITLACSNPPPNSTCTFSPTSVTLVGSSPGTATLTVNTTARPITTGAAGFLNKHFYAVWLTIPAMAFFGMNGVAGGSRRRRRICGVVLLCLVSALLVVLPACSHSSTQPPVSGTPPGQYSMSITGTSGSDSKSVGIQLNVQ